MAKTTAIAKPSGFQATLNSKLADPIRMQMAMNSYITARANMFRRLLDPRRDIKAECGYPSDMTAQEYWELYQEDPLANRSNCVYPLESWQRTPTVYEKEKEKIATPFEKRWDQIGKSLNPVKSYYKEEKYNKVWSYLKRLDILCGVGQYGVMLMGFNDDNGGDLTKPLPGYNDTEVKGKMVFNATTGVLEKKVIPDKAKKTPNDSISTESQTSKDVSPTGIDLKYLRVFPQHLAQVTEYENRPNSPRRGHPKFYNLTFNDFNDIDTGGTGSSTATVKVHWSRVIHVADGLESNEIFAPSRLKPVLYPILDARKGRGAGAEGTWKGTFMGLSIESLPQVAGDLDVDERKLRNMMEDYFNSQDRALFLDGMTAKPIAPQLGDVTPLVELNIGMICIKLGCPIRIFKGSERGELASSQDDDAWNDRLKERQANFIIPSIIVPFVDRLIGVGVLPEPPDGFKVDWPDLTSQSETQILANAGAAATAITTFISGGGEGMVPKNAFIVDYLKKTPEQAEAWEAEADEAIKQAEEDARIVKEEDAKLQADAMKKAGVNPGMAPPPGAPPAKPGFPPKPGAKPPTALPSGKPGAPVPPGKKPPFVKNSKRGRK